MGKNVWVAVLFNFLIPGVGYLYNGKRIKFAIGIFLFHLFLTFLYPLTAFILFFSRVWFGYWAGKEAEKINEMEKAGEPYKVKYPEFTLKNLCIYFVILLIGGALTYEFFFRLPIRSEEMEKEMLERIGINVTLPPLEK